ncbi:MAG: hypothetical protein UHN47_02250 [Lachnospiraceae bacterium]|nr:hypothetical protein [Lachnospiraceae bacterium]
MEDRAKKILEACMLEKSRNPIEIFHNIAHMEFKNTWTGTSCAGWSGAIDGIL